LLLRRFMMLFAARFTRVFIGSALLASCARPVRIDDMSAQAHGLEAGRERAAADAELRKYDPDAHPRLKIDLGSGDGVRVSEQFFADYNPTTWHLFAAQRHSAHELEHERAAADLEAFEDEACRPLPRAARAACPFVGPIRSVESIDHGVRLRLAEGAPVAAVAAHIRCHIAFARAQGFKGSECPLTLRGTEVAVTTQGTAIELTSRDRKIAKELRRRASALVMPVP
jgi:outer membrane murein-binding lipoprotein Lpp